MSIALLVGAAGCVEARAEPWSEEWLALEAERYLHDPVHRRTVLEESLQNHDNTYSRQRLDSYGLETRGWDVLPEWNPRSASGEPLWDGRTPETLAEWVALGREVFFRYPLRAEAYAEHALERPELAEEVGLERTPDGSMPGVVSFVNVEGSERVGITCALCHTTVRDGALVVGEARRRLDYGRLRIEVHEATGVPLDPALARRMATWGPGRADVTEDDAEDPVAIPDLWGLRDQSFLTQAGTIRQVGPAALAIRQETQLLHSNHQRVRPPRELSWALAMFLYSLEPPPAAPTQEPPERLERGATLFDRECRRCHANAAYGGELVPASVVGTDPALAHGGARGTGHYRPPSLLGVGRAAPYLHHGAVDTLPEMFSPDREEPGHPFGTDLPEADRAALVAFLQTL